MALEFTRNRLGSRKAKNSTNESENDEMSREDEGIVQKYNNWSSFEMSRRLTHDCSCKSSFINPNNSFNKLASERAKKLEQEQFLKEEGGGILQFLEQVF